MAEYFERKDMTKWLIHFVKDVDYSQYPEEDPIYGTNREVDDGDSAFAALLSIIRIGGLIPNYSYRNGKTTLFGKSPVVCATEMPLYSFYKYAHSLSAEKRKNVSPIGIAILKNEFFAEGGRPAIYGLSEDNQNLNYVCNNPKYRILKDDILPQKEQYRLVSTDLGASKAIDWTHEREWRWKPTKNSHELWGKDGNEKVGPLPGLPIFKDTDDLGYISNVRIIVESKKQADKVRKALTGFYIAGFNNYDTPFNKGVIKKTKIIILDDIVDKIESDKNAYEDYETIEGLEKKDLVEPLLLFRNLTLQEQKQLIVNYHECLAADSGINSSYNPFNRYNIVSYAIDNEIIQALITCGELDGPFDGKVYIGTEQMKNANIIVKALNAKFGSIFEIEESLD